MTSHGESGKQLVALAPVRAKYRAKADVAQLADSLPSPSPRASKEKATPTRVLWSHNKTGLAQSTQLSPCFVTSLHLKF